MKKGQHTTWVWRKRGCGSYDTVCVTASLALVRTLPIPPPAAKPLLDVAQVAARGASGK